MTQAGGPHGAPVINSFSIAYTEFSSTLQAPTASTESIRDEADGDDDSAVEFPWQRPQGKGFFGE